MVSDKLLAQVDQSFRNHGERLRLEGAVEAARLEEREAMAKLEFARVIRVEDAWVVSIGTYGLKIFSAQHYAEACRDAINSAIAGEVRA
jgi:hypothetical protein